MDSLELVQSLVLMWIEKFIQMTRDSAYIALFVPNGQQFHWLIALLVDGMDGILAPIVKGVVGSLVLAPDRSDGVLAHIRNLGWGGGFRHPCSPR